jgi:hypothetical protein
MNVRRVCKECRRRKPITQFSVAARKRCVLRTCKSCINAAKKAYRDTPQGLAGVMWNGILDRCRNDPHYSDVQVLLTRKEFIRWAVPRLTRWLATRSERPTVDRKDGAGHYELSNLRLASRADNNRNQARNRNLHAPPGQAWCYVCEAYHARSEFSRHHGRPNGLANRCKTADRAAKGRR